MNRGYRHFVGSESTIGKTNADEMILRYQLAIDVATLTKKDKVKNLVVDIMVTIP